MQATTISEVIECLNEIVKKSYEQSDCSGYFAVLYKKVTIAVSQKISECFFDDNDRMEKLDVVFANRYLEAYDAYYTGKECSASWKFAFDATHDYKPMVIHHLFLGMNAHIGLDLGLAAATIAPGKSIHSVQNDFNKINSILNDLVEDVKSDLYTIWPISKYISELRIGKLENALARFSMTIARDEAWNVAVELATLETYESRHNYISQRDKAVELFSMKLLNPGVVLSSIIYGLRLFESGSVQNKIKKLDE